MRHALKLHPDSRCAGVAGIDVEVARPRAGVLALRYVVRGEIGALRLPERSASARADELWRHTCFEAFVTPARSGGYYEFNFAPSTQWAAYHFDDYRAGMKIAGEVNEPKIDVSVRDDCLSLDVSLRLYRAPLHELWRLGLTAVIEETDGTISYWALAHPPGRPDFHHADGFVLDLAATDLT